MSIPVREPENNEIHVHPEGVFNARCLDVTDLVVQSDNYGNNKRKVLLSFITTEEHPTFEGPFRIHRKYTASLHPQASLRKDLESWRGQAFSEEELNGFDLERLLDVPATITIQHAQVGDNVYDNIAHITRGSDEKAPEIPDDYVRIKHREETGQVRPGGSSSPANTSRQKGHMYDDESGEFVPDDNLPF
jgi:hypothetical protein